jgi:hypothetical protein
LGASERITLLAFADGRNHNIMNSEEDFVFISATRDVEECLLETNPCTPYYNDPRHRGK